MKKTLLLLSISFLSLTGFAQVCTPNTTLTTPGIYPPGATVWDSLAVMPNAQVGVAYSQVIQIKAPKDTTITSPIQATLNIDSIRVLGMAGLPASISYDCDNQRCFWLGDGNGCAKFTGTPTLAEVGTHKITVHAFGWVNAGPLGTLSDSIEFYMEIKVDPPVSIAENAMSKKVNIYPNPIKTSGELTFNASSTDNYSFKIIDVTGRKVMEEFGTSSKGKNTIKINRNRLPEGVYIYLLEYNSTQKTGRLIFAD